MCTCYALTCKENQNNNNIIINVLVTIWLNKLHDFIALYNSYFALVKIVVKQVEGSFAES